MRKAKKLFRFDCKTSDDNVGVNCISIIISLHISRKLIMLGIHFHACLQAHFSE